MKKLPPTLLLLFSAAAAMGQEAPIGFYDVKAGGSLAVQGAAVINGGPVVFAWAAGLRGSAQINPIARAQLAVEYADRGMDFKLKTLDITGLMDFGNPFFIGLGLYLGAILNMEPAHGWDYFAPVELGWATEIGYRFPDIPGLTLGFDVHMGLTDMMPKEMTYGGLINQLDIRWGLWLGYDFWAKE